MELTLYIIEILGTISFAISGAIAAIHKKMDLLGIWTMSVVTAVGGGYIRDLTLGITPPSAFINSRYMIIATITTAVFLVIIDKWQAHKGWTSKLLALALEKLIDLSDAVGLGMFTVSGVSTAITRGYGDNFVLILFVGAITGVGGGMLRDVFTCEIPVIFTKRIYAVASLIGAVSFYFLRTLIDEKVAVFATVGLVTIIRLLSSHYEWSLPKV
ncbi:MAG: trimeric intracellular cation channel family protein [Tissierellia bacterium]|nr:trimeric intracellular cation channel family protein [Tissierellia bacterium]